MTLPTDKTKTIPGDEEETSKIDAGIEQVFDRIKGFRDAVTEFIGEELNDEELAARMKSVKKIFSLYSRVSEAVQALSQKAGLGGKRGQLMMDLEQKLYTENLFATFKALELLEVLPGTEQSDHLSDEEGVREDVI